MRSPLFTGATSYLNPSKCQTLIKRVLSLLSAPQEGYGWFPQDSGVFRRNVAEVDGGVNIINSLSSCVFFDNASKFLLKLYNKFKEADFRGLFGDNLSNSSNLDWASLLNYLSNSHLKK